jgi:hypothetical protein
MCSVREAIFGFEDLLTFERDSAKLGRSYYLHENVDLTCEFIPPQAKNGRQNQPQEGVAV